MLAGAAGSRTWMPPRASLRNDLGFQRRFAVRNPAYRPQWMIVLTSVVVAGMSVASAQTSPAFFAEQRPAIAGQTLSASGVPALHGIVDSARNADLRWSDFAAYKSTSFSDASRIMRASDIRFIDLRL